MLADEKIVCHLFLEKNKMIASLKRSQGVLLTPERLHPFLSGKGATCHVAVSFRGCSNLGVCPPKGLELVGMWLTLLVVGG